MDHDKFMDIIGKTQHKAVIKIRHTQCDDLFVTGYNFLDRTMSEGRYPVFARYNHKMYFSKKYVDQLIAELLADNYPVEAWVPALKDTHTLDIKLVD